MQTVEETIEVDVPVREAYEQWSQFEFFPQFMSGVESVTRVSGRITHWVTNVGGAEREFDAEIVEDRPDERIAWRSTDGVSHAGTVSFMQLGPRTTRVWVRLEWSPENLAEKTGAALGFDNMQVRADLLRFKEFIETRGTGTDA
ncbi:SRPBCC family protein [Arthrobacter sp. ISL-65]|uniref:SRPBCC family protein n=1 Tax=Arthrobacter sp. ISL-65 TaxID=2819112 RepID=UPI001BE9F579|nr:SRPBCC family protein [Arthrobacter sp. ISL-65]MBT2547236.1 SRPBCC family protein [Arthrobacter sp. ISL-65]